MTDHDKWHFPTHFLESSGKFHAHLTVTFLQFQLTLNLHSFGLWPGAEQWQTTTSTITLNLWFSTIITTSSFTDGKWWWFARSTRYKNIYIDRVIFIWPRNTPNWNHRKTEKYVCEDEFGKREKRRCLPNLIFQSEKFGSEKPSQLWWLMSSYM